MIGVCAHWPIADGRVFQDIIDVLNEAMQKREASSAEVFKMDEPH